MLVAALFIVAKVWEQPKRPSKQEQRDRAHCVRTMDYHSATERNEVLIRAPTWMNLGNITLGERSLSQKVTDCMAPFTRESRIDASIETEGASVTD